MLTRATGSRWVVSVAGEGGGETLREANARSRAQKQASIDDHPVLNEIRARFPGAELVAIRDLPRVQQLSSDAPDADDGDGDLDDDEVTRRA
jgi:DNA polymerase-3 subunit gamma/tau